MPISAADRRALRHITQSVNIQEFTCLRCLRPYLETLENDLFKWVDLEVDRHWEIATVTRMMFRAMPEERRVGIGFRLGPL
jgi:hypothetical protein